jgi:hypothetical protein
MQANIFELTSLKLAHLSNYFESYLGGMLMPSLRLSWLDGLNWLNAEVSRFTSEPRQGHKEELPHFVVVSGMFLTDFCASKYISDDKRKATRNQQGKSTNKTLLLPFDCRIEKRPGNECPLALRSGSLGCVINSLRSLASVAAFVSFRL